MTRSFSSILALTALGILPTYAGATQADGNPNFLLGSHRAAEESELFDFFNLRQESATLLTDGREHFLYRPSGEFGPAVLMTLLVDNGLVVATTLTVHRTFLDHGFNGVFARDLVGSYIGAAPHASDRGEAHALATLIKEGAADLASPMLGERTPTSRALAAVKNRAANVELKWSTTSVRLHNEPGVDGVESLVVSVLPLDGVNAASSRAAVADFGVDPLEVVERMFEAARTRSPALLHGLCDPLGGNDGDTATVCSLTLDAAEWPQFLRAFEHGRVAGQADYGREGQARTATVPILFGPDGDAEERIVLVERNGRWYLSAF